MNFETAVLPGIGLALVGIFTLVIALVVGHRSRARNGLFIGGTGLMVIVFLFLLTLIDTPEYVWVNDLARQDQSATVDFEAPRAAGYASGDVFVFTTQATEDEVFAAFADEFPAAAREGDQSTVDLDGHLYVLEHTPDEDDFDYMLYNERANLDF